MECRPAEPPLRWERDGRPGGPGLVRAAGSLEILIAGYAIANDATVLTADHFDHIATVSDLQHEYIAPSP